MHNNLSHFSLKPLISAVLLLFAFSFNAKAQDGAKIFKQNCAVCHALTDQKLTGPGLLNVGGRVPKPEAAWLTKWIKNNNKVIASGDTYAKTLVANNGGSDGMSEFEFLTDDELKSLVAYVIAPPAPVIVAGAPASGGADTDVIVEEKGAIDPLYLLLGSIVLLAIIIGSLRSVRHSLANSVNKNEGKQETPEMTFVQEIKHWMGSHRRLVGVFGIVILFIGMKSCWNACYKIGVYYDYKTQKGYKPEQPIKFSHKLHAGENEIACQYCHNTVEKSKHAGIPSVNVCMNCHKGIQKGPQYGTTEIQKIYDASGFNPKTGNYEFAENPIKWIKVHNLPDHVYFNHAQHVVAGKQECTTCHGELKKMTVAEQKSPLTMKWCIECHKKTEVAMEGNAYYDKIHKALKEKYKGQYGAKFTVESIGGLECAKCHY